VLVLRRQPLEQIIITCGNDIITVTVVDVKNGKARLGFSAPPACRIDRKEIHIKRTGEQAQNESQRPE
jgi:carbon storage regulator CsrA